MQQHLSLSGRYQMQKLIQDGLYGPILQCRDTLPPHQVVAIKVISHMPRHHVPGRHPRQPRVASPNRRYHWHPPHPQHRKHATGNPIYQQADQERRIIQILQATGGHPNVLQFHDIYHQEQATMQFIVMEFCAGGDLQELIERQPLGRLPELQALQFFAQIVAGVQFLHTNDIAHRDLSLENVLVSDQNVCKIGDFGLSVHSTSSCNEIVGKRFSVAPEVIFSESYDPKLADLWSLGSILFMLLTGLPLVDFQEARAAALEAKANAVTIANCQQDDVSNGNLEIIKLHGASKLLELWGLEWVVSSETKQLLDAIVQVNPLQRPRPEAMLQMLQVDKQ